MGRVGAVDSAKGITLGHCWSLVSVALGRLLGVKRLWRVHLIAFKSAFAGACSVCVGIKTWAYGEAMVG